MIYKTEMIEVDTAIGFTAATIASAKTDRAKQGLCGDIRRVICVVENDDIRIKLDGDNPTSSTGHLLEVGDGFIVDGSDVVSFRAIRVSGLAKISASYEV
jgi:hypothetical protein